MARNNKNSIFWTFVLISIIFLSSFVFADSDNAQIIKMQVAVGSTTAGYYDCSNTDTTCTFTGISQQDCCWKKEGCMGAGAATAGSYFINARIDCEAGTEPVLGSTIGGLNQIPPYDHRHMFECIGKDQECTSNSHTSNQCVKVPGSSQGYCVLGNTLSQYFCRDADPYCGDQYCWLGLTPAAEICTTATRATDTKSCNPDSTSTTCKYYTCENGCKLNNLPANDYPDTTYWPSYISPYDAWSCNYGDNCKHCNGTGGILGCVSSCEDTDGDGYGGLQHDLFHSDCCHAESHFVDCNDNPRTQLTPLYGGDPFYIHPADNSLIANSTPPSPYCDCDTSDGYAEGYYEQYLPASSISIVGDRCYDGIDNDCDSPNNNTYLCDETGGSLNKIDCCDPGCRKSTDASNYVHPIRNRTCAGDCNVAYETNVLYDRACCPNPTDCVINERCVMNTVVDGTFPDAYYCYTNQWYGGDMQSTICKLVVNDTNYSTTTYSHWNLSGNAGQEKCCGDDPNEYFTPGLYGDYACCNQSGMQVFGGTCVTTLTTKYTWDGLGSGYCLQDSQCLVNPNVYTFTTTVADALDINTPSNNPVRCINNSEFIGDHLCYDGMWTTRTAAIATQLMNYAPTITEGSLFCDTYENALNNYDFSINSNYAENYFGAQSYQCSLGDNTIPCTNNICVFKYMDGVGEHVIIGTSLNNDVNADTYSILEAFGGTKSDCDSLLSSTSTSFSSCETGAWYNNNIKSVIYSEDSMSLGNVLSGNWLNDIQGAYSSLLGYVANKVINSYDFSFVLGTHDYNQIYLAVKDQESMMMITETISGKKYMAVSYPSINTDICSLISNYKSTQTSTLMILYCSTTSGVDTVITGGTSGYYNLINDLGPKIRLQ